MNQETRSASKADENGVRSLDAVASDDIIDIFCLVVRQSVLPVSTSSIEDNKTMTGAMICRTEHRKKRFYGAAC